MFSVSLLPSKSSVAPGEPIELFGTVCSDSTPIRGMKVVLRINGVLQKEATTDVNGQFISEIVISQPGNYYAYAEAYVPKDLAEKFMKLGDVNLDGIINDKDINLIKESFGAVPGSPKWNSSFDLNEDGKIDMRDISIASKNYGLTIGEWLKRI